MTVQIRRALPTEADALTRIAIFAKRHWGYPERWIEIWKPQLTFRPEYFEENESWAAVVDGTPVAFHTLQERGGNGWLENLWVLPEYMGQGIGKQLFLHAVDLARRRGYTLLQLEADPHAVGFYEKMGMRRVGERQSEIEGQPRSLPIMEMTLGSC
ncbi:MAG: GNAT family N-acetyltransferase [Chloroflexota bacterium]